MRDPPDLRRRSDLRALWHEHRGLLVAFLLAAAVMVFFAVRLAIHAVYWEQHRDMALEPWMTIGQVAQSYHVERDALARAVGVEPGLRERLTIADIAARTGRPVEAVAADLRTAIATERSDEGDGP